AWILLSVSGAIAQPAVAQVLGPDRADESPPAVSQQPADPLERTTPRARCGGDPAPVRRRGGRAPEPAARRASRHRLRAAAARHRPGDRTLAPCYAQLGAGHSESERGRASR